MSLSDTGRLMTPLQNHLIGRLCVMTETTCWGGGLSSPPPSLTLRPCCRDWSSAGRGSIFHSIYMREAVSSHTHMLPIRCVCLFFPVMFLGMEASHLPDIGNRREILLKQTQYPNPLGSLYELCTEKDTGLCPDDLLSKCGRFPSKRSVILYFTPGFYLATLQCHAGPSLRRLIFHFFPGSEKFDFF